MSATDALAGPAKGYHIWPSLGSSSVTFGMEQLENAMNTMGGTDDVSKTMERFRQSLDAFTSAVSKEIDQRKRDTLKSVTSMSEEAVHRTAPWINVEERLRRIVSVSAGKSSTEQCVFEEIGQDFEARAQSVERQLLDFLFNREDQDTEPWFDLDLRLRPPQFRQQKIKVRLRFVGSSPPRICFDPDSD